jgi:hypothetical protein
MRVSKVTGMDGRVIETVFPIVELALLRLHSTDDESCDALQDRFRTLLRPIKLVDDAWLADRKIKDLWSGMHYTLTGWIDELFINSDVWKKDNSGNRTFDWHPGNRLARHDYPGQDIRNEKMPEIANYARSTQHVELLEILWIVVHLGYHELATLPDWVSRVREILNPKWAHELSAPINRNPPMGGTVVPNLDNYFHLVLLSIFAILVVVVMIVLYFY